ncbi:hypothetical protein LOTGIDRAFT_114089, partial [Lottia gigantea]
PSPTLLNFSDRTRTGAFNVVWPYTLYRNFSGGSFSQRGENTSKMESTAQKGAYSTRCSQAVTHPSTNRARRWLTSVIGRELVLSTWFGRRHYI